MIYVYLYVSQARPDDISILQSQLNRRINMEKQRPVEAAIAAAVRAADDTSYLDPAVVDIQTEAEAAKSEAEAKANAADTSAKSGEQPAAAAEEVASEPEPEQVATSVVEATANEATTEAAEPELKTAEAV